MSVYPSQAVWASVQADSVGRFAASLVVDPIIRQTERDHASLEAVFERLMQSLSPEGQSK